MGWGGMGGRDTVSAIFCFFVPFSLSLSPPHNFLSLGPVSGERRTGGGRAADSSHVGVVWASRRAHVGSKAYILSLYISVPIYLCLFISGD